ncbi:hypothetical protein NP493_23g05016 [Ridgeia piscesae]|uniref:Fibrinogen C-terminal domain-containing protein n=1 Tax=Ridgeia piscesae TaxID=27915 RepID=A0AAD9UKN4_RIDPI|nr:hypothetical protein NP493_23g05016 [Ridgeia piscesae]
MFLVFKIFLIYGLITRRGVLAQSTVRDSCSGVDDCEESARMWLEKLELSIGQMQQQIDAIQKEIQRPQEQPSRHGPHDCADVLAAGETESGIYTVWLADTGRQVDIFCDMDTDGGGWLVFQRRQSGTVDFFRDWSSYKSGFGNVSGEFWLGKFPPIFCVH